LDAMPDPLIDAGRLIDWLSTVFAAGHWHVPA
jgi:hypothetical protein